jgi:hypothetical protein
MHTLQPHQSLPAVVVARWHSQQLQPARGAETQCQLCAHALQGMLPDWPGRLPLGLTQLMLAPMNLFTEGSLDHAAYRYIFLSDYLLALRGLRHLAFHGVRERLETPGCSRSAPLLGRCRS